MIFLCGTLTLPCLAQGRREDRGPKIRLTDSEISGFNEAWEEARNPSILVLFGTVSAGKISYNLRSAEIDRLAAPLRSQLLRAFPNGLVALDIARARQSGLLKALERDLDSSLDADTGAALSREYDADIILDIVLLPGDQRGQVVPTMRAVDTKNAREIASKTLRSVDFASNVQLGHVYGTSLAQSFGEGLIRNTSQGRHAETYSIGLLALSGPNNINARDLRAIRRTVEDEIRGVKWAEIVPTLEGDETMGRLEVRFSGRLGDLLLDLTDLLEEEFEFGMTEIASRGTDSMVYIYTLNTPEWFVLTDPEDSSYAKANTTRLQRLAESGLPKLGIVVGADIDDPFDIFEADGNRPAMTFNDGALRIELGNVFSNLGFTVINDEALRRQLRRDLGNAERFRNMPHLLESLADFDSVDVLLHVNVSSQNKSQKLLARLIDVAGARDLGAERWPNKAANRLTAYPVSEDDPGEVARFLAGRLVSRWDRLAERSLATTEIRVRNADNPQQVLGISELFRGSIAGVSDVTDVQISGSAASFEVLHDGDFDRILFGAIDRIGRAYPGADIQIQGGFVVINMNPETLSEMELQQLRAARVAAANNNTAEPDGQQHQTPPPETPDELTLSQRLREAAESVYMVGFEINGQFFTSGTGWIGKEGILVTNAHVAIGLSKDIRDLIQMGVDPANLKISAIGGPDANSHLVLSTTASVHTTYFEANRENNRLYQESLSKAIGNIEKKLAKLDIKDPSRREIVMAEALKFEQMKIGYKLPITEGDVAMFDIIKGNPAAPLTIVPAEDVQNAIYPADVIAYVGFPAENLQKLSNKGQVAQLIHIGNVMGMTEFSTKPGTPETQRLLHYDLVTAGGASGSPLFDNQGRVIGLNCAGSYIGIRDGIGTSKRIRTGIAFGQRADLIHELFEGRSRTIEVLPTE